MKIGLGGLPKVTTTVIEMFHRHVITGDIRKVCGTPKELK